MAVVRAWAATSWPKHHFFGNYGVSPWDETGRYLLCLEADFQDHFPAANESAAICVIDTQTGELERVAETLAWNFQQGSKLRWCPQAADSRITYNDRQGDRFVAVIHDVRSGERRVLPRAVSELSHDGTQALCISFSRLRNHYPAIGYSGIPDPYAEEPYPANDGIYRMAVDGGDAELILSYDQVRQYHAERSEMDGRQVWFSHPTYSLDDGHFCFLSRYRPAGQTRVKSALFCAKPDGSELNCLIDYGLVTHFDWRDARTILVYSSIDELGHHYYLVDAQTGRAEIVAEEWTEDGHCTFSHKREWFITDTYPNEENMRSLLLWNLEREEGISLGRFYSDPDLADEIRCDLHPRWRRDDQQICFDSVHEGSRQLYVMDVSAVVG